MRKLGRTTDQRKAMLRGMVTLLLECGKIETTYTRAQEVSAKADEMITLGKKGGLANYRTSPRKMLLRRYSPHSLLSTLR